MPICDFGIDSFCAKLANLDATHHGSGNPATGGLGQNFLDTQQNHYNAAGPNSGCNWYTFKINQWQNQLCTHITTTNPSAASPAQW